MQTNRTTCTMLAGWVLLLAFSGGCAAKREVTVDSMVEPTFNGQPSRSYVIRTKQHGREPVSELRDQEAVQHIKTALSAQGMWEAPTAETADLIVEVDYGIDEPRIRFDIIPAPIYTGVVPSESIRQVTTTRAPEVTGGGGLTIGRLRGPDHNEITVAVVVREKHLTISGRENKPMDEGRAPPEIFRVCASIEDEGTDLRGSLPVLASVVMDKLGQPTEGAAMQTIKENSEAVEFIRRGM